jgi:hypothetical protein
MRSRSLLKNWFGPMPTAKSVVPGCLARSRARFSMAAAGAQVISSTVLGSKWAAYSVTRSKTGRQRTVFPSFRVTSTAPSRSGFATADFAPTWSRLRALGALAV